MRGAVFVNHGRWVAECTADDCRGAIDVSHRREPAGVRCDCKDTSACYHETVPCGHMILLGWPAHFREIDRVLAMRPDPLTRNWLPGETVEELKSENLLHGMRL